MAAEGERPVPLPLDEVEKREGDGKGAALDEDTAPIGDASVVVSAAAEYDSLNAEAEELVMAVVIVSVLEVSSESLTFSAGSIPLC